MYQFLNLFNYLYQKDVCIHIFHFSIFVIHFMTFFPLIILINIHNKNILLVLISNTKENVCI